MKTLKVLFAITIVFICANLSPWLGLVVGMTAASVLDEMVFDFSRNENLSPMVLDLAIWKKYIIERLLKDNSFLDRSKDDSGFVLGGAVVYIPQAGAKPVVAKNRSSFPAVAVRRTDTDINYVLDSYSTDPTHIPWQELQTISYNKLDSILGDHMNTLGETVADDMLVRWSPASTELIQTTGAAIGPITGQTGNRKGMSAKDVQALMLKMNTSRVPKDKRVLMIDDNMYGYFYDTLSDTQASAYNRLADMTTGIVGRLHGFDILTRSTVLSYDNTNAVKAFDAALGANDNLCSMAWHPSFVCRAVGETKPFQSKDDPLYYGDIYSMIVRMGGRKERGDRVGVYGLVQAASA